MAGGSGGNTFSMSVSGSTSVSATSGATVTPCKALCISINSRILGGKNQSRSNVVETSLNTSSNPSSGRTPHPSWLGTSALRATCPWSRAPAPAKHRRPRSAHTPQRLAATRCGSTTQSHERRAAHHAGPRQPSHARIPIRALCQQSLHHHSLLRRPVISVPLVSSLAPQAPPPPASPH